MKTSDKIISALLLLAIIAGGGYYIYTKQHPSYEGNSIVDVEVEPACLAEYYIANAYPGEATEEEHEILEVMNGSDASYFNVVLYPDESNPTCQWYQLWQTDQAGFEEYSEQANQKDSAAKAMDHASEGFEKLFNYKFTQVDERGPKSPEVYRSWVIEECFLGDIMMNVENEFQEICDGNVDRFFVDNHLELSCESVEFTKIGAAYWDFGAENNEPHYFLIGTADVLTESADGDVSSTGFWAPVGETKTITIQMMAHALEDGSLCFYSLTLK